MRLIHTKENVCPISKTAGIALLTACSLTLPLSASAEGVVKEGPVSVLIAEGDPATYVDNPALTTPNFVEAPVSQAVIAGSSATFDVRYASPADPLSCTGTLSAWPAAAQGAFTAAATIWANLLNSVEPIVIDACWLGLNPGVLGSAGPRLTRDWSGAPKAGTWYPFAIADALSQEDRFAGSRDIRASFSSNFTNWYFGTDGNTPAGQFDFLTVVLHEIGHGLGFSGGSGYSGGNGSIELGSFPTVYGTLSRDGVGQLLTDYADPSTLLGSALTGNVGGGVFFHGSASIAANGGMPAKLYTPAMYNQGSSYSHFAESFNGTADALMTHSIGTGVSETNIGPVTLALLKDAGWPAPSDSFLARSLAGFSFNDGGQPVIDFNFNHTGTEALTNFYFVVHTANNATMGVVPGYTNGGGVGSILSVDNFLLPGGDQLFSAGEDLVVPIAIDITGPSWQLNFDVFASDEPAADRSSANLLASATRIGNFTIDADELRKAQNGLFEETTIASNLRSDESSDSSLIFAGSANLSILILLGLASLRSRSIIS